MGIVADGALAELKIGGQSIAVQVVEEAYDGFGCFDTSNGSAALKGAELVASQLQQGVPVILGHAVVLLLRLGRQRDQGRAQESRSDELLRGSSAYMHGLRQQISLAAGSDLDVLIRGETGTGKELVAATIHRASRRASAPLVSVNMAAIPPELAPAALFGSAKGAFTGADRAGVGYFVQAQGGSLFLDEIGDTAQAVQPQLLRALQQREVQAVGGPIRRVDLRVISATDAPLDAQGGGFKAALRHRLGACEIHLLPLREHPEDIGELLLYFLTISAAESHLVDVLPNESSAAPEIAAWAGLFYRFLCYRWPGNVRELANFARQVVLASEHQLTVVDNIEAALQPSTAGPPAVTGAQPKTPDIDRPRKMKDIDEVEFDLALQQNRFEAARVARQLGVSRTAVYRRIEDSPRHRLVKEVPASELQRVLTDNHGDLCATALQLRVSQASLRTRLRYLA